MHAVAERVADLDPKDLAAATAIPEDSGRASGWPRWWCAGYRGTGVRAKACNELAAPRGRPRSGARAEKLRDNDDRFFGLIREAVVAG